MPLQSVLHSFAYSIEYLCEQLVDVAPTDMTAQPAGVRNHPAWTIGHLTHVCEMIGGVIGVPAWLPDHFAARYGPGSAPTNDSAAYEPKAEAIANLLDAWRRVTDAAERFDEARLDDPFPDPAYRDVFPTIRHALTQVLVAHTAYHVGQIAAWRKAMGLPAMGRPYE